MEVNLLLFKNFTQFTNVNSMREDLISFLVHNITSSEWIERLYQQLKKLQAIKNSYKRKEANNKLFSLITYLKENFQSEDIVNYLCYIDKEIYLFKIPKKPLNVLKEYKIPNYNYYRDYNFRVDIFKDIFHNWDWKHIIEWSNNSVEYYKTTKFKKTIPELLPKNSLGELSLGINTISLGISLGIIHGQNSMLKKLNVSDKWKIYTTYLRKDDIWEEFRKINLQQNNKSLDSVFQLMRTDDSKLIIGEEEMKQSIEYYMIKEAYCSENMFEKLKSLADPEYYNFNIIIIGCLEKGDSADIIERDYGGYIGIKYY